MPFYCQAGSIPPKRHSQFRQPDGSLYFEELFSTAGFSGISSLLYHAGHPVQMMAFRSLPARELKGETSTELRPRSYEAAALHSSGDVVSARAPLLFNGSVTISLATPDESMSNFARNSDCDELVMVHEGSGTLASPFGELAFGPSDIVIVPRGTTTQWRLDSGPVRMLIVESAHPIDIPSKLRNEHGQLLERSPFCERDIRVPKLADPITGAGSYPVRVKHGDQVTEVILRQHPFDVVGWDGYVYPYALSMNDVEPITGSLHQMPDVYQIFGSQSAAYCVMPPHPLDYHPLAVPSPPVHSNVDSDEVLFTVAGTVPGRPTSTSGHISFHPAGLAHGPKYGGYEASIGAKSTDMLAFMIDTFEPLRYTPTAAGIEDPTYFRQWLPAN